ncbi:MAG: hypothetical protein V4615_10015 [Bacteroidota bacterium]
MKKYLPAAIILLMLFFRSASSQSVTLDVMGGYCFSIAPSTEATVKNVSQIAVYPYYATTYAQVKRMSYGKGGNLSFNFNWYSKKNIGFGFKGNILFGSSFKYSNYVTTISAGKETFDYTDNSFSVQLIPHLCFRHDYKVVGPVLEAGMIIGMAQIEHHYTATSSVYSGTIKSTVREHGNALLGFYSSVGLSFNVSKVVKINLAVNCVAGSYSPSKWKRTSFTLDGKDQMMALNTSQKQGEYVKELDFTASQGTDVPSLDLKYSAAFSNVGVTTGVCFIITKKQRKVTKNNEPNVVHPF